MKIAALYWCVVTLLVTVLGHTRIQTNNVNADLNFYLESLNQIVDFFYTRKYYLNTVAQFGLLGTQVNLKKSLIEKGSDIPASLRSRLIKLVSKVDILIRIADSNAGHNLDSESRGYLRDVISLFNNDTTWISQIEQFHHKKPKPLYKKEYVKTLYPTWRTYLNSIDPFQGIPTPQLSDECLLNLSTSNPINYSNRIKKCKIAVDCQNMVASGSLNGYGLTHRLLFLQMARYGRRCYVKSNAEDRRLRNMFCTHCYYESLYIDINDFKAFDLMLEQIFLCALEGRAEFIKRDWLLRTIERQEPEGCFQDVAEGVDLGPLAHDPKDPAVFEMLDERCNGHTTILAAGVLGAAIRFLLEISY